MSGVPESVEEYLTGDRAVKWLQEGVLCQEDKGRLFVPGKQEASGPSSVFTMEAPGS